MTYEQDRADLARHEADIRAHQSFNDALFDAEETVLLGCVYIDPPEKPGADPEISWWVGDGLVGTNWRPRWWPSCRTGSHSHGHSSDRVTSDTISPGRTG